MNSKVLNLLFIVLSLATFLGCQSEFSSVDDNYRTWRIYGGDAGGTRFSLLDEVNRQTVGDLEVAWIFRMDDMRSSPATTIECNPIIVDEIAYLTSPGLELFALEAGTGKPLWSFDPFEGAEGRGVNRGVAYWGDESEGRIFYVAGKDLYALDSKSGALVTEFGTDGKVDLRFGLGREPDALSVSATTPGIVFEDLLILGSIVGEGPTPAAPGHIRAYDVRTGEMLWIFHTIPHPGEIGYETWPADAWKSAGGANSWGGMTVDEERGWVFADTGSPSYDHYGGNRIGQNLFGNTILALDARTGKRIWHFQVVHHDLWDYDIPCPPNLVTVQKGGRRVDAVAQATKMGLLFLLDRETGEPLFPVEERPVPSSELSGEEAWPTQPFPLKPPPYVQQQLKDEDVTRLSEEETEFALERLREFDGRELYIPPGLRGSVVLPQFNGGTDWGGAAFDPSTGMLYVNASNEAEWISMVEAEPSSSLTLGELGYRIYQSSCSSCHGSARSGEENQGLPGTSLESIRNRGSFEEIEQVLLNGKGQMPAFPTFNALDRRALISFILEKDLEEEIRVEGVSGGVVDDIPFVATGHNELRTPSGFPLNRRPWGVLNAIDLNEGEIAWKVPLGTYPELEEKGYPPTGTFNMGGPLVTAGGLVFIGASMDERFRAFDRKSGEVLWEFQLDAGAYATPATFEVNGKQYVLIAAGGGGKPGTPPGNAYYCFALP